MMRYIMMMAGHDEEYEELRKKFNKFFQTSTFLPLPMTTINIQHCNAVDTIPDGKDYRAEKIRFSGPTVLGPRIWLHGSHSFLWEAEKRRALRIYHPKLFVPRYQYV